VITNLQLLRPTSKNFAENADMVIWDGMFTKKNYESKPGGAILLFSKA